MKVISIKKMGFFALLTLIICGFFSAFSFSQNGTTYAEQSMPEYFTVKKYSNYETTNDDAPENTFYSLNSNTEPITATHYYGNTFTTILNNSASFINNQNIVQAKLYLNNENFQIESSTPILTINGVNNTLTARENGIFLDINTFGFTITSIPTINSKCFGKYELNVNYLLKDNYSSEITSHSFSFTYYVLNQANYFSSSNINTTYNKSSASTESVVFDRVYMYNYQDETATETFEPIKMSYNKNNFNIVVTKTFHSVIKTQTLTFDGTNVISSGANFLYYDIDENFVNIVFNDLGVYSIKYNFIYTYGTTVNTITSYGNEYTGKKQDRVDVFGFQLFYSDINLNGNKEFKNIYSNGTIGQELTDYSYLFPTTSNTDGSLNYNLNISDIDFSTISIQKTNQAPVQFQTNATIQPDKSCYYTLTTNSEGIYSINSPISYSNEPFTKTGKYLVKVVYEYADYTGPRTSKQFAQWFLFELTNSTPEVTITHENDNTIVSDGSFTNQSVIIEKTESDTSIFNAPTKLYVKEQTLYSGVYKAEQIINSNESLTVSNNANYLVRMCFGKNYSRYYESTFTIDKTNIENIQLFNAKSTESNTYYTKQSTFDFWTNQNTIITWNEKISGAKTFASYKYIPLEKDYSTNYDSATLKQFYTSYNVPVEYNFSYDTEKTLTAITHSNSQNDTFVNNSLVLSQNGMYIFQITDQAGNENYIAFIIDKTPNKILQQIKNGEVFDTYTTNEGLNIVSNDTKISWGKNKVIRFNNLFTSKVGQTFSTSDSWLNTVLNNTDLILNYFTPLTINTITDYYTCSEINSDVIININGIPSTFRGNEENKYSYTIPFLDGNGFALENQYNFFTIDSTNTKTSVSQILNYQENYSGTHSIKVSSDASLSELYYTKNQIKLFLNQDSTISNPVGNTKIKYYEPTTVKTLNDCGEILSFIFNAEPQPGVIEIDSIEYEFYDFVKTSNYNYSFNSQPTTSATIYSKNDSTLNQSIVDGDYLVWQVLKEYNAQTSSYQTRPGKYVITRKYDNNLSGFDDAITNLYDYEIRKLTFIVDRFGIISPPITNENKTVSYVGNSVKLQVLEDSSSIYFENIYTATNQTNTVATILKTNKLPVQVYIPITKFGYSTPQGYITEDSIEKYTNNLINTFKLRAQIKYSKDSNFFDSTSTTFVGESREDDTYLSFNSTPSHKAFTEPGYYKVSIFQGNQNLNEQNVFEFIFQIIEDTPSYTITNTENVELYANNENNNYYTNKNKIKLQWEDDSNEFKAKINPSAIYYSIDNRAPILLNSSQIITNGLRHSMIVDLNEIRGYYNNARITFSMQFEGKESDYTVGHFKTERTLIIDTVAPSSNINRLVANSGLTQNDVRIISEKYNTSVSSGLYKYYSFAVDVSKFSELIDTTSYTNGETFRTSYRIFDNKYIDTYTQETSVSSLENSDSDFTLITSSTIEGLLSNIGKYIEIYETDMAGNVTVYTIYLTSQELKAHSMATSLIYKANQVQKSISYNNLSSSLNLYARNELSWDSIELYDYAWSKIQVNNKSYIKSPYSSGKYYDLSIYNNENPTQSLVSLENFTKLSASNTKHIIKLSMVPYFNTLTFNISVLNTELNSILTGATSTFKNEEGILIKIPSSITDTSASIYASSLEIKKYDQNNMAQILVTISNEQYFKTTNQNLSGASGITGSYVTFTGNTYIKFIINNPIKNTYYEYTIIDNFGGKYVYTNIYGTETITNVLSSNVPIAENYENGIKYYYSTKDIYFKYNSLKDKLQISITTPTSTLVLTNNNLSGYSQFVELIIPTNNSTIYTVILHAPLIDLSQNITGSVYTYKIEISQKISPVFNSYETYNIKIYNIIPQFNLIGIENENQNDLFNKGTMYVNEISVNFTEISGYIPCTVWLSFKNTSDSLETTQLLSGDKFSNPGEYTIIIKYSKILDKEDYYQYFTFTISDNDSDFYNISYSLDGETYYAKETGNPFTYFDGNNSHTITTHYIINSSSFTINYNTSQAIEEQTPQIISSSGFTSYIYKLSNVNNAQTISGIKYFSRTIAVTIIPKTSNILSSFNHYKEDGLPESMLTSGLSLQTFTLSAEQDSTSYKRLGWKYYYGIKENIITATIYYGNKDKLFNPEQNIVNSEKFITLTASGVYYLVFKDLAGNTHKFDAITDTFTIRYLRSVIYTINGETPINNAVYDSEVTVNVAESTLSFYDSNARPYIFVEKNGEPYSISNNTSYTYIFKKPGLYKIWFSASIDGTAINQDATYFLIVNPNETRWSYEFSEYSSYYVKQIIKNKDLNGEEDCTERLTTLNMGTLTSVNQKNYLKNLVVSLNDQQTGAGKWTITIATNNSFNQEFTFTIWLNEINEALAPLKVSIKENDSTIDVIKVTFNTNNMLEFFGDCKIRIKGMEDFEINNSLLSSGELNETYTISINDTGTYYVQVLSQSGKLLYSYKVTKVEPLNTISIIVIVIGSIVFIGLIVLYVLLRKRMKIR